MPSGRPGTPRVSPSRPADGQTSGSTAGGTPNSAHSSPSKRRAPMSKSSVRDALVTSVACGAARSAARSGSCRRSRTRSRPPRRARAARSRCRAASESWSPRSTDRAPGPVCSRSAGSCPAAFSWAHSGAVRRSCQTMALATGRPSARSQSSVVSRWLVMPMAAIRLRVDAAERVAERARDRRPDRLGIVLDLARARVDLRELAVAAPADGASRVDHQHGGPGGPLVDRENQVLHGAAENITDRYDVRRSPDQSAVSGLRPPASRRAWRGSASRRRWPPRARRPGRPCGTILSSHSRSITRCPGSRSAPANPPSARCGPGARGTTSAGVRIAGRSARTVSIRSSSCLSAAIGKARRPGFS